MRMEFYQLPKRMAEGLWCWFEHGSKARRSIAGIAELHAGGCQLIPSARREHHDQRALRGIDAKSVVDPRCRAPARAAPPPLGGGNGLKSDQAPWTIRIKHTTVRLSLRFFLLVPVSVSGWSKMLLCINELLRIAVAIDVTVLYWQPWGESLEPFERSSKVRQF